MPREDTTGSNATEERGSKDASRLSSVREIFDFPLAARIRRILATSRESVALSNDSESRAARRRSRLGPCERASGPRAEVESAEGFLDPGIPYLNTTEIPVHTLK